MPEGDTIHRAAARLRPALEGAELLRFEAPRLVGDRPRPGDRITSVEAVGKHLLVHFASGLTLQTHMRMTGSWHLYRTGERWQRPAHLARCQLHVDGWVAVCFAAPVVRTYRPDAPGGPLGTGTGPTAHLGPDLTAGPLDAAALDTCVDRMVELCEPDADIADVLLDQRVAAGVGNVFKSEVLWACAVHPFVPLATVDEPTRRRLLVTAGEQLRANLGSGPRTTVPGGLAVYGRQRRPCLRCGTPIRMRRSGAHARSTYWCPTCQPEPQAGGEIR